MKPPSVTVLDPEVAAALASVPALPKDVETQRKLVKQMNAARPPAAEDGTFTRTDVVLPAAGERPDLGLRVYTPQGTEGPRAATLYFHSGGFAVGDLDVEDSICVALCRMGCAVVSVDYRLAPEHQAPAPVHDGYDALQWVSEHAAEYGVTPGAIGVCGLSAGGGIAAAVALLARDRGAPAVAFQMLLSPALDDRMHWPSCRFEDVPLWNRADTEEMWRRYLGADPEARGLHQPPPTHARGLHQPPPTHARGLHQPPPTHARGLHQPPLTHAPLPYGAPNRAKDLSDLPAAYVATGELDPMRDAAIDYATRLLHAGVSVELHVFPGVPHGWDMFCPKAGLAKRALAERGDVVRRLAGIAVATPGA